MGGFGSKPEKKLHKELNIVNFLDVIATKYILTQNFQDLKKLTQREYCNKLIILTSKVIKKFFKERDITYLAERIEDGIPYNRITTENVIYLDTAPMTSSAQGFSKKEKARFQKEEEQHIQEQLLKQYKANMAIEASEGGGIRDYLKGLLATDSAISVKKRKKYTVHPVPKKTLLAELDVRNPVQKERMCKGIAKFYIKVAHLFAAIAKTINPRYVFTDSKGKVHEYSIWNKTKIPAGAVPHFVEDSLCSRRITAVSPERTNGEVSINMSKVCKLNRKVRTLTQQNLPDYFTEHGKKRIFDRTLGEEEGIPALEELYNDKYNYTTGKFTQRISGGKGEQQYKKDLKEFYEAFASNTDKGTAPYAQWNAAGDKRFADVPLAAYHNNELCKGDKAKWKQKYTGRGGLFADYANHINKMIKDAQVNQKKLLAILQQIFIFVKVNNIEETKVLTLNPKLTYASLEKLVDETREAIVALYVNCQKDFQTGLNIFEGILMERNVKNAINQNASLKREGDKIITMEPDQVLTSEIQKNLVATVGKE